MWSAIRTMNSNRKMKEKIINKPILHSRRPTYGESKLATILGFVYPQISTARAGTFEVPAAKAGRTGVLSVFNPKLSKDDFRVEILKTERDEGVLQNLFEADIIVSGGRGTTGDGLKLIKKLAEALKSKGVKAEWACSRVVVDEGVAEYAHQIGQTGKTVSPKLYIACGISGAIQHLAGMSSSKYIVAINKDKDAPIFNIADYGIAGDVFEIIPALTEEIKKIK